jgi:histone H3/H4
MASEIINVGPLMRKNAYCGEGRSKEKLRVSPGAVKEYIGRIQDHIEINMPGICNVAKHHKRSTVFDDDITEYFSITAHTIAGKEGGME